jgi:hypothetical protein
MFLEPVILTEIGKAFFHNIDIADIFMIGVKFFSKKGF